MFANGVAVIAVDTFRFPFTLSRGLLLNVLAGCQIVGAVDECAFERVNAVEMSPSVRN